MRSELAVIQLKWSDYGCSCSSFESVKRRQGALVNQVVVTCSDYTIRKEVHANPVKNSAQHYCKGGSLKYVFRKKRKKIVKSQWKKYVSSDSRKKISIEFLVGLGAISGFVSLESCRKEKSPKPRQCDEEPIQNDGTILMSDLMHRIYGLAIKQNQ